MFEIILLILWSILCYLIGSINSVDIMQNMIYDAFSLNKTEEQKDGKVNSSK